jgi:hypothetical protein
MSPLLKASMNESTTSRVELSVHAGPSATDDAVPGDGAQPASSVIVVAASAATASLTTAM